MPISEDEYEHHRPNQSSMSKAEQRRNNKPIMEKRRRARINHCLNELKALILDAMKKDPARHSKLEKADILEMTVKHLQSLQRQQLAVAVATDPTVLHKFKTGFNECAGEVSRYIGTMDGVETGVKQRLVAHLNNCVTGMPLPQPAPFSFPGVGASPVNSTANIGDVNNNQNAARIQVPPGIQLIPSRLPTGELALLVPNSSNLPFFNSSVSFNSTETTQRSSTSAFTTVKPSKHLSSPPLSPASSTTSFDDHQVSESFQKPRTPSPKEVTVSFPTPPGSSAFKSTNHEQNPAQQFQISSTSYSPESTKPELKIEYKTVPIYQHTYKMGPNKSMEPLSVITSDKSKVKECRKRPYPCDNSNSEGLLVMANPQPSTSKYVRYSLDDVSTTSSSSSGSPDQRFSVESRFHQPSTSGHAGNQQGDANNDHMWRPW